MLPTLRRMLFALVLLGAMLVGPTAAPRQASAAACFNKYLDYNLTGGGQVSGRLRVTVSWCAGYKWQGNGYRYVVTSMTGNARVDRVSSFGSFRIDQWDSPYVTIPAAGYYAVYSVKITEDIAGPDNHWVNWANGAAVPCSLAVVYPSGTMTKGNCVFTNIG